MFDKQIDSCGFSFLSFQNIIWNEHIGNGSSGDVYKCTYNSIDCIGKCFYLKDYENKKGFIDDIYSELWIYQFLKNMQGVSEIIGYSYDEQYEYICILMRYYTSISLNDYIQKNNISEKEKLSITKKLCNSLKEIHSRNIIHCDIKPHNIIYDKSKENILFIDFGASVKIDNSKTIEMEENMGTEGYMSDELSFGTGSYKGDVYSLGVTILELWMKNIWNHKKNYRLDVLQSLRELKKINLELSIILKKCVAKDIQKRISLNSLIKYINMVEI